MRTLLFLLYPFALLYGIISRIRNKLYDWGVCSSKMFDIPVISVGNLSVGGTGKTPCVEYLIRLLQKDFKVATLSRGYGRNTKGFYRAGKRSASNEIGDEPVQLKQKFKNLVVAVDENRVRGIENLTKKFPELDVILLDDAFQHRAVKPGLSILLTDFHNLYPENYPLPTGTLREFRSGAKRADIILVTKTNKILSPITARRLQNLIKPKPHQKLCFSYIKFGGFVPLPGILNPELPKKINSILLFAGIANIYPLEEHLRKMSQELEILDFKDHHEYSFRDLEHIRKKFDDLFSKNKIIVTTEKDAMRLCIPKTPEYLINLPVFYVPIEVKIHKICRQEFNEQIIEYVKKNSGNRKVSAK